MEKKFKQNVLLSLINFHFWQSVRVPSTLHSSKNIAPLFLFNFILPQDHVFHVFRFIIQMLFILVWYVRYWSAHVLFWHIQLMHRLAVTEPLELIFKNDVLTVLLLRYNYVTSIEKYFLGRDDGFSIGIGFFGAQFKIISSFFLTVALRKLYYPKAGNSPENQHSVWQL